MRKLPTNSLVLPHVNYDETQQIDCGIKELHTIWVR